MGSFDGDMGVGSICVWGVGLESESESESGLYVWVMERGSLRNEERKRPVGVYIGKGDLRCELQIRLRRGPCCTGSSRAAISINAESG